MNMLNRSILATRIIASDSDFDSFSRGEFHKI